MNGRISLSFRIVGDAKIGGIVDETNLAADAGRLAEDDASYEMRSTDSTCP
jgi:hypothetical protein